MHLHSFVQIAALSCNIFSGSYAGNIFLVWDTQYMHIFPFDSFTGERLIG